MSVLHVVVCYTVLAITVTSSIPRKQHCSSSSFTFSLISSRNRTGHWTSQVQLEHLDDETSLPWNIKVDHSSAQCDGMENVGLIATVSVRPSPDYELVQGLGYYKLYTEAATWDEARETCIREGTHLLILNSGAEMDAVKSIWAERPNVSGSSWPNYIHVGVHDRFKEGQYVTILDQPLSDTGYAVWDHNEPNNAGGEEDCLSVKNTGGLNDIGCDLKLAYMCEREL